MGNFFPLYPIRVKWDAVAGAVSVTWFALGVQAPNYIFVIREQYQTKPDKHIIDFDKFFLFIFAMLYHGVMTHMSYFFACNFWTAKNFENSFDKFSHMFSLHLCVKFSQT